MKKHIRTHILDEIDTIHCVKHAVHNLPKVGEVTSYECVTCCVCFVDSD